MRRFLERVGILFLLGSFLMTQVAGAQGGDEPEKSAFGATSKKETPSSYFNLPLKTLGGKQLWTDFAWNHGWRLQQHAVTGHWRVVDEKNIRRAWGERAGCESVLRAHKADDSLTEQRFVVLLHGLLRSSGSMASMAQVIEKELDVRTIRFDYASTRKGIDQHAIALRSLLESLPEDAKIDFVCHSMGNIVVRHMLSDLQRDDDPRGLLPRFHCMVMLGPPNHGADIARQLSRLGLFELVTGQGGMELGPAWHDFKERLATPSFPFMIVAGDTSGSWLSNPILQGPSDLLVRVDEAKLDGCQRFEVVPVMHALLMSDKSVQRLVIRFLQDAK